MTASQLVAPIGIPLPVRVPALPNSGQLFRAKRCLFGVSDSEETEKLFREEELRNYEHLRRYVIITDGPQDSEAAEQEEVPASDVIDSTEQANTATESTEANNEVAESAEASVEVAESVEATVEVGDPSAAGDDDTEPTGTTGDVVDPDEASNGDATAQLAESSEVSGDDVAQPPSDAPTRFNPGPLGCFRVRKTIRGKPYELRAPKDCFHPPRSSRV